MQCAENNDTHTHYSSYNVQTNKVYVSKTAVPEVWGANWTFERPYKNENMNKTESKEGGQELKNWVGIGAENWLVFVCLHNMCIFKRQIIPQRNVMSKCKDRCVSRLLWTHIHMLVSLEMRNVRFWQTQWVMYLLSPLTQQLLSYVHRSVPVLINYCLTSMNNMIECVSNSNSLTTDTPIRTYNKLIYAILWIRLPT